MQVLRFSVFLPLAILAMLIETVANRVTPQNFSVVLSNGIADRLVLGATSRRNFKLAV